MPLDAIPFLYGASVVVRGSQRERPERFRHATTLHTRPAMAEAMGYHLDKMRSLPSLWSDHPTEPAPGAPEWLPISRFGG